MIKRAIFLLLFLCSISKADWLSGWDQRIKYDIDYTNKIGDSVTGRSVKVFLKAGNGDTEEVFNEIGANNLKQAFTTSDGTTEIYAFIEKWDTGNKEGIIHVGKSDWTINADTYIYQYYDNDHADNTDYIGTTPGEAPATNVWKSDIVAHWAMNDSTIGTWKSPDGNSDPDSAWTDETKTYDENLTTYAYNLTSGHYLELTLTSPILCDKVRIYIGALTTPGAVEQIDVYYSDDWHNIYNNTLAESTWVEVSIGSTETVSKARVIQTAAGNSLYITEFDFYSYSHTLTVEDSTSNGNDGTKKGIDEPVEATGKIGEGQDFDGDDYVYKSGQTFTDLQGTVCFWVNMEGSTGSNQWALGSGDEASANYWIVFGYRDSSEKFCYAQKNNDTTDVIIGSTTPSFGTSYHVAFVSNGSSVIMYVNGVAEELTVVFGSNNGDWFGDTSNRDNITLGALYNNTIVSFLNGLKDEVIIANTALSAAEIKMEYNSGNDSLLTYGSEETFTPPAGGAKRGHVIMISGG